MPALAHATPPKSAEDVGSIPAAHPDARTLIPSPKARPPREALVRRRFRAPKHRGERHLWVTGETHMAMLQEASENWMAKQEGRHQ